MYSTNLADTNSNPLTFKTIINAFHTTLLNSGSPLIAAYSL